MKGHSDFEHMGVTQRTNFLKIQRFGSPKTESLEMPREQRITRKYFWNHENKQETATPLDLFPGKQGCRVSTKMQKSREWEAKNWRCCELRTWEEKEAGIQNANLHEHDQENTLSGVSYKVCRYVQLSEKGYEFVPKRFLLTHVCCIY